MYHMQTSTAMSTVCELMKSLGGASTARGRAQKQEAEKRPWAWPLALRAIHDMSGPGRQGAGARALPLPEYR